MSGHLKWVIEFERINQNGRSKFSQISVEKKSHFVRPFFFFLLFIFSPTLSLFFFLNYPSSFPPFPSFSSITIVIAVVVAVVAVIVVVECFTTKRDVTGSRRERIRLSKYKTATLAPVRLAYRAIGNG